MRILFIARKFPPSVGGMERFAYEFSSVLAQKADVRLITWGGSNKWLPLVMVWFFLRASWVLATRRIDIIHVHDGVQAPLGWVLHALFRRPYIVVVHGLDVTYHKYGYQRLIVPFIRRADIVVAVSQATRQELLRRAVTPERSAVVALGVSERRITTAQTSRAMKQLGIEPERRLLLTTGRLVKRKGTAWFVSEVVPKLVRKYPSLIYMVVGEGGQRVAIERAIVRANVEENVRLLGRVPDETREALYRAADVFVMPNIVVQGDMEGFGIVALEAAIAGLPVVASDLEGIKDALTQDKNARLVPTTDVAAFVDEISHLLDDEKYRRAFGASAREYTEQNYSWQTVVERYLSIYAEIMDHSA